MDTSKMRELKALTSEQMAKMLAQSEMLKAVANEFFDALDASLLRNQIVEVVESNYDLGKVTDVYEIFGGYVNRSFGIYTEKDGKRYEYFVRKYKKDIEEKEILFEHKLITHAINNGFDIAAGVYKTKDGKTYVKVQEGDDVRYFAVYRFLPGEDKYTWIDNMLTDEEYASSAEVLASFHNSVRDFDPEGFQRVEPKIMDLLPMLPPIFEEYAKTDLNNRFHSYYLENFDAIIEECNRIRIPEEDFKKMPQVPIHCDFHPGNEKFQDGKVVGLFDFDWSKIDIRLFEIGLALVYFCSPWTADLDGTLLLDKCKIFLEAYQRKLRELGGLEPLNEVEKRYLPEMLAAGNMYLIYWCLRAYYGDPTLNVYEYVTYLQHQVRCMYWIRNHCDEILKMAEGI